MTLKTLSNAALVLVLPLSMAACMGGPAGGGGPAPLTPTSRYSLQVEPGVDRIALGVHDGGLSPAQQSAVADIANRFGVEGGSVIRVEAPGGGDPVSNDFAFQVKAALERFGAQVQIVSYDAPDPRAPVLVGYETLRASVPQCGTSWGNLTRTNQNDSPSNFGCAVTANLAAQIENPRDIIQPRGITPSNAGRRTVVFDNYRKGEATAAHREDLIANTRVSQAVN